MQVELCEIPLTGALEILRSEVYLDVRRNKPVLSLSKRRMRGGVATNKERLFATPPRR
jgi:hypothetical protein